MERIAERRRHVPRRRTFAWLAVVLVAMAGPSSGAAIAGADLGVEWMLPFAGLLGSIALLPLLAPTAWHDHYGKIALGWAVAFVVPFAWTYGPSEATHRLAHALVLEYLPFVALLFALYTVSAGIGVSGGLRGTPATNTSLLALGAVLANLMGTTGASMMLVRPLIRANAERRHRVHVIVFFIFVVGNAGGALTPLGDPPLFLGFLNGVSFFWTAHAMLWPALLLCGTLLAVFYALDARLAARDDSRPVVSSDDVVAPIRIDGKSNLVLLLAIVGAVLLSGFWRPGVALTVFGSTVALQNVVRDALLVGIALLSLATTPRSVYAGNGFTWAPMQEVAKLFAAIFVTIVPAIAILEAGDAGALAAVTRLVSDADGAPNPAAYFWLTGLLSAFLDNAPTYLIFFTLAGGDADALMTQRHTLAAISGGAVFMGALSYIGNAPNFMVRSIAEDRGIAMPSFFGYLLWSVPILVPLFGLLTWLFFR